MVAEVVARLFVTGAVLGFILWVLLGSGIIAGLSLSGIQWYVWLIILFIIIALMKKR